MKHDSDNIENYAVIIKPNKKFEIIYDSKNRHYKDVFSTDKKSYYSILTKFDYVVEFNLTKQYKIHQTNCLISKIILDDFPITQQYTMCGNGIDFATAQLINNKPTFNIDSKKRSTILSTFINLATSPNEHDIDERDKYLNIGRLVNFGFLTNENLENRYNVKLTGLFFYANKWIKNTENYVIFPYENDLNFLIGLTKELYFYSDDAFEIGLRIEGVFYGPFLSNKIQNSFENYIKFTFDGWNNIVNGKQNEYVSDEINRKSVNLCKLNNISVILIDGSKKLNLYHYSYKMYDMEYCSKMFI
jgi:hypothetical protein